LTAPAAQPPEHNERNRDEIGSLLTCGAWARDPGPGPNKRKQDQAGSLWPARGPQLRTKPGDRTTRTRTKPARSDPHASRSCEPNPGTEQRGPGRGRLALARPRRVAGTSLRTGSGEPQQVALTAAGDPAPRGPLVWGRA